MDVYEMEEISMTKPKNNSAGSRFLRAEMEIVVRLKILLHSIDFNVQVSCILLYNDLTWKTPRKM